MFYQILFCSFFSVVAVAVIGLAQAAKKDKTELKAADQFKNLSVCCRAQVVQGLVRRGTMYDPEEYDDFCSACGHRADIGLFLVNPEDGTLTDTETGQAGLEETPGRDLDFGGPDPDEEMELRRDLEMDRRGR